MRKQEYDYFNNFIECSQLALDAAHHLQTVLNKDKFDPSKVSEQVAVMHRIENDADGKKHESLTRLAHEFMTPIEREDIVALSQQLDNVVDSIEDVAQKMYMFDVQSIRPDTAALAGLIVKGCEALLAVTREFPHFRKSKTIKDLIIEVNSIESEGDKLHAACMRTLFTDGTDLRETMIWMVMYDNLEACLDACEDAADIVESVIMKNT